MINSSSELRTDPPGRFLSFTEMQLQHAKLLKLYRETPKSEEVLKSVGEFIRRGQSTGVILDADTDRMAAQTLLDYWSAVMVRAGVDTPESSLEEFDPALEPSLSDDQCPYRQSDSFAPAASNSYFGRQRLLQVCLEQLQRNNLLAIVGPSGSGRSSLVRTVLLPALKTGALAGSENWRYFPVLIPSKKPLAELACLIVPAHASEPDWISLQLKAFSEQPTQLVDFLDENVGEHGFLILDGFDQMLKLSDKQEGEAILSNLLSFANTANNKHKILLIINSEYLRETASAALFNSMLVKQVFVAFDVYELRQAIEEPAKLVGLKFEEGLVNKLLLDVTGDPSAATLLQFSLLRLWRHRKGCRITWEAYNRLGGGRVALARAAEALYCELTAEEQKVAKRILMLLVDLGLGREVSRATVPRNLFHWDDAPPDRVETLLTKLVQAGLLCRQRDGTRSDETIQLAHEGLLSHWPRLVEWLDNERDAKRRRLRLFAAAEQWRDKGRDPSALWRGSLLQEAKSYLDCIEIEKDFVEASSALEVTEQRRERKRLYRGVAIFVFVLLVVAAAVIAGLWSYDRTRIEEARHILKEKENETRNAQLSSDFLIKSNELIAAKALAEKASAQAEAEKNKRKADLEEANAKQAQTDAAIAKTNELHAIEKQTLAESLKGIAQRQRLFALAEALAADAPNSMDARGALLAFQAYQCNKDSLEPMSPQVDHALRVVLSKPRTTIFRDSLSSDAAVPIFSVAFSRDGRLLLAAGRDGSVRSWDWTTNAAARILVPRLDQGDIVIGAALDPYGEMLAVCLDNKTNTTLSLRAMTDPNAKPISLPSTNTMKFRPVFSPNGQMIAAACVEGFVQKWEIATSNNPRITLRHSTNDIPVIAFSSTGILATGGRDGTVRLWYLNPHAKSGEEPGFFEHIWDNIWYSIRKIVPPWRTGEAQKPIDQLSLQSPTNGVTSIAFAQSANLMAIGGGDGSVQLWDLTGNTNKTKNPEILQGIKGVGVISAMAFNSDARFLAAASWDGTVQLWDLSESERTAVAFKGHQDGATSLAFSPDSRWLASGSIDKTVRLWRLPVATEILIPSPAVPRIIQTRKDIAFSAAFSSEGHALAIGRWDGTVQLFRINQMNGISSSSTNLPLGGAVLALALSKNADYLAAGSILGTVRKWDLRTSNCVPTDMPPLQEPVLCVAFSPDAQLLAVGTISGKIRVWDDLSKTNYLPDLTNHLSGVVALAFSPDKTQLASGSWDGTARLWSLNHTSITSRSLFAADPGRIISAVAFSPDGGTLAAGTADGIIYLQDLRGTNTLKTLKGHEGRVLSLAFSANGQLLASGSFDNTVRLWDLGNTDSQFKLRGHTSRVLSVTFSEDNHTILSSSPDQTMLSWIGPTEALSESTAKLAEEVWQLVPHNLTTNEWEQDVGTNIPYKGILSDLTLRETTLTNAPTTIP
jgi:WD40 repeat protein